MFFVGKTDINIELLRMYEVMMIFLMPQAKIIMSFSKTGPKTIFRG